MKNLPVLVVSVILVLAVIGFAIFAVMAGGKISNNGDAIATLERNVTTLQSAINSANGDIATLKGQVIEANGKIGTLQTQVTADAAKITTAQGQVASATTQITALQSTVSTLQTQNASQTDQITAANGQIATLQTQVAALNSSVTTLQSQMAALQSSSTISVLTYGPSSTGPTNPVQVAYFTTATTGTLVVSGFSNTAYGMMYVYNTSNLWTSGQVNLPQGTTPTSISIPLSYTGNYNVYFVSSSGTTAATIYSITRY